MLCLTSIPYSINQIYISIKRVQNDLNPIILNYGFISIVTIVGSYLIINIVGLIGIGIVWFFANTIIATTILFKIKLSKK
jgi:O-antigen/teichoic acid export membrane protein